MLSVAVGGRKQNAETHLCRVLLHQSLKIKTKFCYEGIKRFVLINFKVTLEVEKKKK